MRLAPHAGVLYHWQLQGGRRGHTPHGQTEPTQASDLEIHNQNDIDNDDHKNDDTDDDDIDMDDDNDDHQNVQNLKQNAEYKKSIPFSCWLRFFPEKSSMLPGQLQRSTKVPERLPNCESSTAKPSLSKQEDKP